MRVSLKKSDVFIPDWRDNLELPEGEQVKFHYKFLGSAERARYVYRKPTEYTFDNKGGDGFGKAEIVTDGKGLALRMVTRIENLEVETESGQVRNVETIEDFYKHSMPDLASLVEAAMLDATAVVDSKNSE